MTYDSRPPIPPNGLWPILSRVSEAHHRFEGLETVTSLAQLHSEAIAFLREIERVRRELAKA